VILPQEVNVSSRDTQIFKDTLMKKIVLVSNTSWALYNFRLKLIKLLIDKGVQVYCIANLDDYTGKLISIGVNYVQSHLDNKGLNPINDLEYQLFLYREYRKIEPDFIFHYTVKPNIYGSLAAHKLGIRSVAFVSGTGYPFLKKNLVNYIVKKLYKTAGSNCTEMWFINKDDLDLFTDEKIVNKEKTRLLPGEGVDVDYFSRTSPYPVNDKNFKFLLSSRLIWDKGIGIYVDAAREIKMKFPWVRFQLLGYIDNHGSSSIDKKQIDEWVNEGVIEYLGGTSDVKKYLMSVNCLVMPSYYKEGIPKTLLEACSLAIPVITTDNTGCRDVVIHGYNGLLSEPKNSASLAESMELLLKMDYNTLKTMGENGRKKVVAEFNEDFVLEFYKSSLKDILTTNDIPAKVFG
jgi:glycosyltransferase involved in cell wall biosynthesis